MTLRRDVMGWSAVCDCDISWSYSLTFYKYSEQRPTDIVLVLFVIREPYLSTHWSHLASNNNSKSV